MALLRPHVAPAEVLEDLADLLADSARDVFATMVGCPLTAKNPVEGEALRPASNVVGIVGFTGSYSGLVVVYATFEAAREITARLVGLDDPDASSRDEVADAIGEVTNMIAGSFRTRMAGDGDTWAITVPTVTLGSDFYIKPMTSGRRALLPFGMGSSEVLIELIASKCGPRP